MRKILCIILIFAFAFPIFAQRGGGGNNESGSGGGHRGGGGGSRGGGNAAFMETLELTPEQREVYMEIRREHRERNSVNFINLNRLRNELLVESAKDVSDSAQINRIVYDISQQHLALSLNMYQNIRKLKEVLSNEQFERFIEHRKNRINRNVTRNRNENKQNE